MALTPRQTYFYTDTVDIHRHATLDKDANNVVQEPQYNATAQATSVACMWQSMAEDNQLRHPAGRLENDILFTLDRFFFDVTTDIKDQDAIKVTTSGHPQVNQWFIVQGFGKARVTRSGRRGNYVLVYAKRVNTPPGL